MSKRTLSLWLVSCVFAVPVFGQSISFLDAQGQSATAYREGERAHVRLVAPALNSMSGVIQEAYVQFSARDSGDQEGLSLFETGPDTGVFEGVVRLGFGPATIQDGVLQTARPAGAAGPFDRISVLYLDPFGGPSLTGEADVTGPVLSFLDVHGEESTNAVLGFRLTVRAVDASANATNRPDTDTVRLVAGGDQEILTLHETGPYTGVFEGSIPLSGTGATPGNGTLQAAAGATVEARLEDGSGGLFAAAQATAVERLLSFRYSDNSLLDALVEGSTPQIHLLDASQPYGPVSATATSQWAGDQEQLSLAPVPATPGLFKAYLPLTRFYSPPNDGQLRTAGSYFAQFDTVTATACPSGCATLSVPTVDSVTRLRKAGGGDATAYAVGAPVGVWVYSPAGLSEANVRLESLTTGDSLTAVFFFDSYGNAQGEVPSAPGAAAADGVLQVQPGEVVRASYLNGVGQPSSSDTATVSAALLEIVDAAGSPVDRPLLGRPVFLQAVYPGANTDPSQAETVSVRIDVNRDSGFYRDRETLTLTETGPDTGIFSGSIPLAQWVQFSYVPNGILEAGQDQVPPYHPDVIHATLADASASAAMTVAKVEFVNGAGTPVSSYQEGSLVHFRLEAPLFDQPGQQDSIPVEVRSDGGDRESAYLMETGTDTGIFTGSMPSAAGPVSQASGTLDVRAGDTVEALFETRSGSASGRAAIVPAIPPPSAQDDTAATAEDTPVTFNVLANDTSPRGLPLSIAEIFQPASGGTVAVNADSTVTFTPTANFFGSVSFDYRVTDGVATATGHVYVTVDPVQDPPVAVNDVVSVNEDTIFSIDFLANDRDPDGDPLLINSNLPPDHGTVFYNFSTKKFDYFPEPNYAGTATFRYSLRDTITGATSNFATVTINVLPVNDPPVAADDTLSTNEDEPFGIDPLFNDYDPDSQMRVSAVTQGAHGTVTIAYPGPGSSTVLYTPAPNYFGTDSFTYTADDGAGGTAVGTVNVTISAVNDAPTTVNDSATTDEDTPVTVDVLANDSDVEGDTLTVSAVTQGTKGAVVINPDKTVRYTPNLNANGTDSFTYTANDGHGGTKTATVSITITPVNDAPDAVNDTATANEDTAVTVTVLANDTDADNQTLSVTAVTQGTQGTVVINPNKTVTYTPNANVNGTDTFTYTISDGSATDTATVSITITAVNDAPDAVNDAATTNEDAAVNVAVLGNDTDAENQALSVTAVTQGAHGTAVIQPDKTVTYTPALNYNGSDTFTYTISDGSLTDTATVSITITAVNDAPSAVNDTATTNEDTAKTIAVLANDTDADGDSLSISAVTQGTHGSVAISGSSVIYTPNADYNGSDSFTYTVSDGKGGTATGTVSITIAAVNDAPAAVNDSASTNEDTAVTVSVLGNDSDVDGDTLAISAVTQGTRGSAAISGATVVYTPNANYNGSDSFTYTVSDGKGGTATGTVSITIAAVNDAPTVVNDSASTNEDAAVTVSVLGNDSDVDGDTLTISAVTQGTHGSAAISGSTVIYTPNANYNGSDSFTYTVSDGNGGTRTATVSITIAAVNDAPVAANDSASTNEDVAVTVSVLGNDSDVDGNPLTISAVTQPTHGSAAISGSTVVYTPGLNYNGSDSFTYTISDGNGGNATATVSITIAAVNDAPVAVNDSASTNEDAAVTVSVLGNDSDPEGDTLTLSAVTQPTHGSAAISGSTVIYTPNANYNGSDSFTYTVSDGNGGNATATVTITVSGINDAPVAINDSAVTNEDAAVTVSVLGNDGDLDGDTLTLSAVTQGTHGSVAISGSTVIYTPNANYNGGDSFTYTVSDGNGGTATAAVSITINPVNDAPVAVNDSASTSEDAAVSVSVVSNDGDPDGDSLTISAVTQGSNGSVAISGSAVIYTPNANFNGSDSFTYTVSDGNGGTATAAVSITVSGINDAPVAVNDSASTNEDTAKTIAVLTNDTDADGDTLAISAVTQGTNGSAAISGSAVIYTPNANYNGSDSFTYTISDGNGGTATATVSITVSGINDAPNAVNDSASTSEDVAVTVSVLGNDSDQDGDSLTISAVTQPTHGSAAISGSAVIYTPNANYNGSDSFTYTISDGNGGTATATVSITVSGINDAPDAVNDAAATNEDTAVTVSILANDTDADGEALTVTGVTQGSLGAVTLNANGTVTYVPAPNANGADSFSYTVRDAAGATDTATVTVAIAPVNDPPVAAADGATTREGVAVTIDVRANDSDIENNSLSITAVSQPASGTATLNANGTVTYTPTANFNGTAAFTYTLSDGQGGTATGTVTVTVKDALERVAVLATHGIWIQTGADVLSGDVIVNQTGSSPFLDGGGSELSIAGTVTTPAGWDVQANRINVTAGATVAGDAFFNQLTGSVSGSQSSPLVLPVFATLPAFLTATPGTTDVNVGTNGTRTLAPGSYRDLIVGRKGTVTFTGGVYHFRSIRVDRDAKLLFSASADVRVQQKLSTLQTTTIGPAAGATIDGSDVVFFVAGVNGTGGGLSETPKAVEIGTDNVVWANVYAPNGTIWWKDRTQARGSSLGKDVQVGPDVQVTLDSFWTGQ